VPIHRQASTNTEYSIRFHISFNTGAIQPLHMDNMEWPGLRCQFTMWTTSYSRAAEGLLWCIEDSILNCLLCIMPSRGNSVRDKRYSSNSHVNTLKSDSPVAVPKRQKRVRHRSD
jgi:hypothetical protein